MTFTHALSTNNYGPAKFIVSSSAANGTHTTIQAAITAATSGDTVFIRSGSYTEDLTLKAGVNLAAWIGDGTTANINITGKATLTSGVVTCSGIRFTTNSDFAIVVSGSSTSLLTFIDCYINASNGGGISFTSSNSSSALRFWYSEGNTGAAQSFFTNSSTGNLQLYFSTFTNTGSSTAASNTAAGAATSVSHCNFATPLTTSSSGVLSIAYSNINTVNTTCVTTAGTGASTAEYSDFISGTASAISVGSGSSFNILSSCRVDSSNAVAITGAGSFNYSLITYTSSANVVDVTTQTPNITAGGGWSRIKSLTASASASLEFKTLPVYSVYAVVFNNVLAATNAQDFEMLASSNNGSTYANSGYTSGINFNAYNSTTINNATATTYGLMARSQSNGIGLYGTVYLTPGNGGWWGQMSFFNTTLATTTLGFVTGGAGIVFNALKFQFASGNITSGSITLYGLN